MAWFVPYEPYQNLFYQAYFLHQSHLLQLLMLIDREEAKWCLESSNRSLTWNQSVFFFYLFFPTWATPMFNCRNGNTMFRAYRTFQQREKGEARPPPAGNPLVAGSSTLPWDKNLLPRVEIKETEDPAGNQSRRPKVDATALQTTRRKHNPNAKQWHVARSIFLQAPVSNITICCSNPRPHPSSVADGGPSANLPELKKRHREEMIDSRLCRIFFSKQTPFRAFHIAQKIAPNPSTKHKWDKSSSLPNHMKYCQTFVGINSVPRKWTTHPKTRDSTVKEKMV